MDSEKTMGTIVREYDLLESLGAGGMGEVFKARHTLLDAHFAVKVIHKDLTRNPEIRQRFLQEAKFLARLDHPGIMRLRNVFEEAERLYIVTDYLKGENLARMLHRAGTVPLEDGMDWLYQIAAGVEYAHKCGVVHRDLKPANIMVLENGTLQILDFGLAKQFDEGNQGVTSPDQFVGTPPYIPPEVLKGDVKLRDIGPEADVYALAVMAYRIYSGRLPYGIDENDSPLRQLSLLIRRHIDRAPVEPLRALRPDLPGEFSDCILHVLTVPHVSRPHSAKAFIEMLIRCAAANAPLHGGRHAGVKPPTREIPLSPAGGGMHETVELTRGTREIPSYPPLPEAVPAQPHPEPAEKDAPPKKRRGGAVAVLFALVAIAAAAVWYQYFRTPPPPPVAGIVIKVSPDDARISLDGRIVSRSSLHEDSALNPGRHELLVEKRGHQPYRETIEIAPGATVDRVIMLQKAVGTLHITTEPPGATVTVDGTALSGVTPLEAAGLQADVEHAIEARVEGREAAAAAVTVGDGERRELALTLGVWNATIDIETTPDEAGIWLDEEYVGTTPAEIDSLEPKREFAVRISRAGYAGVVQKLKLAPGERRTIRLKLARLENDDIPVKAQEAPPPREESRVLVVESAPRGGSGFINAEATPAAYLYVDGKFTGRLTPIIGHAVPAGQHVLTLRTPDGREQAWQVHVKSGETAKINKEF